MKDPTLKKSRWITLMPRIVWICLFLVALLRISLAQAASDTYFPNILVNGKLQRFNDSSKVLYYRLDALENSPGWDYRKWDFLKDEVVKQAFQEWELAMGGKIDFRETTDPKLVDIAVHWRNGFDDRNILGIERPNTIGGKFLIEADIEITLTSGGKPLDEKKLKAVALHEIGHALGMNGHSPYPGDLMYPSIQPGVNKLSARDIRTIEQIYATKPDITNPPGVHLAQFRASLDSYYKGMDAYQKKQPAKAYPHFVAAHQQYPQDPTYMYMAGLTAYQKNDLKNALVHLEKLVAQKTQHQADIQEMVAEIYLKQGEQALKSGKSAEAKQCFQKSQSHYKSLLQNPKTTSQTRKEAQSKQAWLSQQLSLTSK